MGGISSKPTKNESYGIREARYGFSTNFHGKPLKSSGKHNRGYHGKGKTLAVEQARALTWNSNGASQLTPTETPTASLQVQMSQLSIPKHQPQENNLSSLGNHPLSRSNGHMQKPDADYSINKHHGYKSTQSTKYNTWNNSVSKNKRKKKTRAPLPPVANHQSSTFQANQTTQSTNQVTADLAKVSKLPSTPFSQHLATKLTPDLALRLTQHPSITFIPFVINNRNQNRSVVNLSLIVPLPFEVPYNIITRTNSLKKWQTIEKRLKSVASLCQQGHSGIDILYTTICGYSPNAQNESNFQMLSRPDIAKTLVNNLPIIAEHALILPTLLEEAIPYLNCNESKTIFITRRLCSSLLANAFFCTFPAHQLENMPDVNFFRLYNDTNSERCEVKKEKLKCILNYFTQLHAQKQNSTIQNQIVSFERRFIENRIDWAKQSKLFCDVQIEPVKKIEQALNMLQVDFANKLVGGGVLNDGSVMEEIRFCISPELIVARLFTQAMNDDEILVVTGTEIYSEYTGYSKSFKYKGPATINWGQQPVDNFGRTYTQLVTMDATSFRKSDPWKQFQKQYIDRDLHKSKVAFMHGKAAISPVATGNWGCGAFNGNIELKFIIQWIAASQQDRPFMQYHTNRDQVQGQALMDMCAFIKRKQITIGQVYQVVIDFLDDNNKQSLGIASLFAYIKYRFGG